jgi:hypothetical protein
MIPVILAGSAWRMLDDCYKAPIINFLLDTVIGLLKAAPSLPMFGLLWPMIKAGVIGFLEGVKGKPDNEKVAITNKLAKIISGGSPAFILGFVKGLLKGIWEGLTDPFVLIYEAIKGLGNLVTWLNDVANQALSPTPTGEKPASAQAGAASPATAANKNVEMGQRMQQMAGELEPPVQQVSQGFMPAVQEVFSGGGGMSFEQLMQKLGDAWAGVETAIRNAGGTLADKVCQFMLQDNAEGEMGETVKATKEAAEAGAERGTREAAADPYLSVVTSVRAVLSEDTLDDICNWIVAQGKEYYAEVFYNPHLMPSTVNAHDPALRVLSEVVKEHKTRYAKPIPYHDDSFV